MADFVAVIRRAVDGLATNTPEARVRVYEKARGAVQRQLENMKPRPPEEMLRRQMDKLEAAIAEVETEHAEALPSETAASVPAEIYEASAPAVEPIEASVTEPEVPVPATEPVVAEEENASQTYAAQEPYEQPVEHEVTSAETQADDEWRREPEPDAVEPAQHEWNEPAQAETVEPVAEEPKAERYGDWRDEVPDSESTFGVEPQRDERFHAHEDVSVQPPERAEDHEAQAHEPLHHVFDEDRREQAALAEHDNVLSWPSADHDRPEEQASEAASTEKWDWSASDPAPTTDDGRSAATAWDNGGDLAQPFNQTQSGDNVDAHFSPEMRASVDPVRMPAASDIPDLTRPADAAKEEDPFEAYVNAQPAAPAATAAKPDDRDPWSDLEDLIGYTKEAPATEPGKQQAKASEDDLSDLLAPPAKPYRVTAVRKRNYGGMILGLIGLLLLAGGGYALWINRDSLNDMVGGLIEFGTSQTADQAPATSETAQQASPSQPAQSTPPAQNSTPPAGQNTPAAQTPGTPPPADGSSSAGKFTQRLMQDGSETDAGPGDAGSLAQNAEGQSVSQLNAPPADPGPTAPVETPAAGGAAAQTPPASSAPAAPTATPSETPAAAGERMFLYEERIGQSAPTAIEGTVSWSLQREAPQGGGAPEPMVQGRITIPGRGLTALLTLKRNTDSSLPASHLIEIVFAVPPDFEGGAIDSVLRIAMKQTEQDRGNALVAVPAKITDDFHMIALNDFPDARATNLELLRTRDWIDIPVAYRNGRRALLTLQKGPDGKAAFDEAISEWSQQSGTPNGQ